MQLEERFSDNGVNVSVPFGPTAPPRRQTNFMQRPGLPYVRIQVVRERDGRTFETSAYFPQGNDTAGVAELLLNMRAALRALEVNAR